VSAAGVAITPFIIFKAQLTNTALDTSPHVSRLAILD
jgi:hypothetical protein